MHNRTRSEIIADILSVLDNPELKTSVMYKSRLSHAQLKNYYKLLIEKGLVEEKEGKWVSTDKGKAYLKAFKRATKIIGDFS